MSAICLDLCIKLLDCLSIDCGHTFEFRNLILLCPRCDPNLVHLGTSIRRKLINILSDTNPEPKHLLLQRLHVSLVDLNRLVQGVDQRDQLLHLVLRL